MKPIVGPLLPPNTPPGLPHGLDRGGVFEASDVSPQYIDAHRRTIPTDSPMTHNVTTDVFFQRVAFKRPDQVRAITGVGQPPGYQRHYTSFDQQHRHAVDLPQMTRPAAGHRHGYGQLPTVVRPFGQHVQGMGPQPGYMLESADAPPLPIPGWSPVARPHGTEEGGIFGRGTVVGGMAVGPGVPGVRTKEIMVERSARPLTGVGKTLQMPGATGVPTGTDHNCWTCTSIANDVSRQESNLVRIQQEIAAIPATTPQNLELRRLKQERADMIRWVLCVRRTMLKKCQSGHVRLGYTGLPSVCFTKQQYGDLGASCRAQIPQAAPRPVARRLPMRGYGAGPDGIG